MFRISSERKSAREIEIVLDGKLNSPSDDSELESAVERARNNGCDVALDLSGLQYVGPEGIRMLQWLQRCGVRLKSPTPYVREALGQELDANAIRLRRENRIAKGSGAVGKGLLVDVQRPQDA